ncbi:hypothetical protein EVAR_26511_1 [Eumeta japonica]|uniref:Uncharacterized protein n=1 Tax=Eumeta variegata TaxID=151549 RepID=A0A4C1V8P1_EUMVA|nr:hypothetical protein EVAR_26511_1 [Eumeta japonica]
MFRRTGGETLLDKIRNEHIRGSFKVVPITDKIIENQPKDNPRSFDLTQELSSNSNMKDLSALNELPLQKLLSLKNSLHDLMMPAYTNVTTTPPHIERFGSQAMAMKGPVKRTDHETAFLAFGGYLLCLIVQAVKSKTGYDAGTQPTFFVNSGVKKRPGNHFASYGRRRRDIDLELPPEQLFKVLLDLCEAYAKWSQRNEFSFPDVN